MAGGHSGFLRRRPALLGAAAVVVAMSGVTAVLAAPGPAPISRRDAAVSARVLTMPASTVSRFLRASGVNGEPTSRPGEVVVMQMRWRSFTKPTDAFYTVVLAGASSCHAGVIDAVYGPPDDAVSLGSGDPWTQVIARHRWLAGDKTRRLQSGEFTNYEQLASIRASYAGPVVLVGHLVDACAGAAGATLQPAPIVSDRPVVGVGAGSGSNVYWVQRVAG